MIISPRRRQRFTQDIYLIHSYKKDELQRQLQNAMEAIAGNDGKKLTVAVANPNRIAERAWESRGDNWVLGPDSPSFFHAGDKKGFAHKDPYPVLSTDAYWLPRDFTDRDYDYRRSETIHRGLLQPGDNLDVMVIPTLQFRQTKGGRFKGGERARMGITDKSAALLEKADVLVLTDDSFLHGGTIMEMLSLYNKVWDKPVILHVGGLLKMDQINSDADLAITYALDKNKIADSGAGNYQEIREVLTQATERKLRSFGLNMETATYTEIWVIADEALELVRDRGGDRLETLRRIRDEWQQSEKPDSRVAEPDFITKAFMRGATRVNLVEVKGGNAYQKC